MKYNYTDELDYKNWNSNLDNASKFYCNLHFTKKLDVQYSLASINAKRSVKYYIIILQQNLNLIRAKFK